MPPKGRRGKRRPPSPQSSVCSIVDEETEESDGGESTATVTSSSTNDEFLNNVRAELKKVQNIAEEMIPFCLASVDLMDPKPEKEVEKRLIEQLESALMPLILAEKVYIHTDKVKEEVLDEFAKRQKPNEHEYVDNFKEMHALGRSKLDQYQSGFSQEELRKHPSWKSLHKFLTAQFEIHSMDSPTRDGHFAEGASQRYIPTLDPLTKKALVDPVTNKICKHIYGRASILELIKTNPKTRCPTVGCQNQEFVKESHLQYDKKLLKKIQMQQQKEKKKTDSMKNKSDMESENVFSEDD